MRVHAISEKLDACFLLVNQAAMSIFIDLMKSQAFADENLNCSTVSTVDKIYNDYYSNINSILLCTTMK